MFRSVLYPAFPKPTDGMNTLHRVSSVIDRRKWNGKQKWIGIVNEPNL